jgi:1-hydroxycarotenoid 3,4-desaturase
VSRIIDTEVNSQVRSFSGDRDQWPHRVRTPRVIVIGAGVGGLASAISLASRGAEVTLLDGAERPGGKLRELSGGVDAGPTVFTMRFVFDQLFAAAGTTLERHLTLRPLDLLARHAWNHNETLDLFADVDRSADAIGGFAGAAEAAGYRAFRARAAHVHRVLDAAFMQAQKPTALSLTAGAGLADMWRIAPFSTLWRSLGGYFRDPRLRQLFGRYATYSGSSPFQAPATLMLIADVEHQGVWTIDGGMARLAEAMTRLAVERGTAVRANARVAEILTRDGRASGVRLADGERIDADAVICAADVAALSTGLLGPDVTRAVPRPRIARRSLSAVTWTVSTTTGGFPLSRHNVFFSRDYAAEFDAIFRRRALPAEPTVYVCAQDRGDGDTTAAMDGPERLLILINAPANGDHHSFTAAEFEQCETATFGVLSRCGLTLDRGGATVTTPSEFARMFPATGGALYGQAVHGPMAAFRRPGARSAIPGLYLAGGSVHPGPGLPMAALSGRLAADAMFQDLTSA